MLQCAQESVKSKHPQLLYESRLYSILSGGGTPQHSHAHPQQANERLNTRVTVILYSGHSFHPMVWHRGPLQRDGDGSAGPEPRGSLQPLQSPLLAQDRPDARRPTGTLASLDLGPCPSEGPRVESHSNGVVAAPHRVHPCQEPDPPRHQARQLPHRLGRARRPGQRHRLWPRQALPRPQVRRAHSVS